MIPGVYEVPIIRHTPSCPFLFLTELSVMKLTDLLKIFSGEPSALNNFPFRCRLLSLSRHTRRGATIHLGKTISLIISSSWSAVGHHLPLGGNWRDTLQLFVFVQPTKSSLLCKMSLFLPSWSEVVPSPLMGCGVHWN